VAAARAAATGAALMEARARAVACRTAAEALCPSREELDGLLE
jgi:hypothetical protein